MGFDNDCILFKYHVPANYFCLVCGTHVYPNEALQTPCNHLFCKPCLAHIASSTQACPHDGQLVTEALSKLIAESNKGLADAVGRTVVLCNYHKSGCMWVGTLSECIVHRSKCAYGNFEFICIMCGIKLLHRDAEDHAKICNVNVYPQVQNPAQNQHYAQLAPQMHRHLPSLGHSNGQSQPPPQSDGHPHFAFYPQFQNPQSQQVLQAPPQQYPLSVQPLSESVPTVQAPVWFAQPPFPLRPLEPPMRLPSQRQPPMPHQYVQLPQVSAGYTSGPVQGQSPQVSSGGPPQLLQQPHLEYIQPYYFQPYIGYYQDGSESSDILRKTKSVELPPAPVIQEVQPPRPRQYVQLPQVSAGYTSGLVQGQSPQVSSGGPPQLLEQPPLGKTKSMSWCRICKVDCGSVEGLEEHCQTHEHQRITMDMVRKIKQKSAQIAKATSKSGREGSLGRDSKP